MPTTKQAHIIIIDDEQIIRDSLSQLLSIEGYLTQAYERGEDALKAINKDFDGIVITDLNMAQLHGLDVLKQIQTIDADIPVIMLTGYADVQIAVTALREGAYDFFEKPINETLLDSVSRAVEKRQLVLENRHLKNYLKSAKTGPQILGDTPEMQKMMQLLNTVVDTPTDVLIQGETGAGKEMVARYLHEHSEQRCKANFVAINCGAVPEHLIESELFGSRKGAYTGADANRIGKLEFAQGGTVFLDEIESMPLAMQVKILRVIEERKVTPVGSNKAINLDIRFVAATKVDLLAMAGEGLFRSDLYYRLNLVTIHIPPLRARKADIPLLFRHFSSIAAGRFHKPLRSLKSEELEQLMRYDWPGNVRELRNIAERHVLLGLPLELSQTSALEMPADDLSLAEKVAFYECALIEEALSQTSGSVKEALSLLKLPRKTFYDKVSKYGIERNKFITP
ncbi:sigma-54-dependent transcriptional regulator [Vibrio sinaloensis]|uniref:sigma-54-dependent transcriptional regulator n=1 Tax=Photobacterium sp. (strain ATCC 43367) TaxID=379097 RepID=UPI00057D5108|nr:sigma-54 dependent transcriptional regulator [Vibrio sinaloensis]KHT45078.1 C4-dicarboxylate ABC transporter [Vibrio sinaloensis]